MIICKQSSFYKVEALFNLAKPVFKSVEAATVVRQSMLNLSDPKLQILDVIFDPILAGTDGLQVFQGVVGNVIAHASIVTELERRGKFFHNVIMYLMGNSTMGCPKKHPKAIVQIFQIILANE